MTNSNSVNKITNLKRISIIGVSGATLAIGATIGTVAYQQQSTAEPTTANTVASETNSQSSTSSIISKEATAFAHAHLNLSDQQITTNVYKVQDGFAATSISSSEGGGAIAYFLKKVDDTWVVIGTSLDDRAELESQFGLPANY